MVSIGLVDRKWSPIYPLQEPGFQSANPSQSRVDVRFPVKHSHRSRGTFAILSRFLKILNEPRQTGQAFEKNDDLKRMVGRYP